MKFEKMFEHAIRNKLRFPFKGTITIEDLYDLSLRDLDEIFKSLNSQMKQANEESLEDTKTKEDKALEMQIEIVKYIHGVKKLEEKARLDAKAKAEKKQKLLGILASKQEESMLNMTEEQILAELEAL